MTSSVTPAFLANLAAIVGERDLVTDPADCWAYGYDNSRRQMLPEAVAWPASHDEVVAIVRLCGEHKVPLVARGLGSATTGAAVPVARGLVLAMERMNRIVRVDGANRALVVEAGATNAAVQQAAGAEGFFWPPDPTSAAYSTIGGNLGCNAGGPHAVKYGTTRDNVLGLRAVAGDGHDLRTGVYTTKGVVGYDLTRLLIGSEGTLAVITEATLKITPRQPAVRSLRAVYADVAAAAAAVSRIMAQPVTPCVLEFIDHRAIGMIRDYAQTDLPEGAGAMLLIEVDGAETQLGYAVEAVRTAAAGDGLVEIRAARDAAESAALWQARKALSPALRKIAPKKINEDVVVPVSRMAELVARLEALGVEHGITIVNFGHAGNGNLHVNLLVDPGNAAQMAAVEPCLREIFETVLALGGTLSGEHGVGLEKRDFVALEIEPATLALMKKIKQQFDPHGILNPGKFFPDAGENPFANG
ncbi:MAG TPA: FAD-linked oxidase C-terminal domain-containing protein, partial [Gammaproteobacteria bacterium]|nr:FAD-linked oxidase C-terminal domain-containing protein [Gammaproteobacteria bacterium]